MRIIVKVALVSLSILLALAACTGPSSQVAAPPFTLTDIKGNQISLSDFKGQKAVMLIFFNYRIGTGQDPMIQSYLGYYPQTDKLQVLSIMNRGNLPDEMKQYMAGQAQQSLGGLGFATPLRDEDGSVSQAFGANPDKLTVVLVDRDGNIRFHQEIDATADVNTELARQVGELTK